MGDTSGRSGETIFGPAQQGSREYERNTVLSMAPAPCESDDHLATGGGIPQRHLEEDFSWPCSRKVRSTLNIVAPLREARDRYWRESNYYTNLEDGLPMRRLGDDWIRPPPSRLGPPSTFKIDGELTFYFPS